MRILGEHSKGLHSAPSITFPPKIGDFWESMTFHMDFSFLTMARGKKKIQK